MTGAKAAMTAERSGYVNRGPRRPQGGDSRGDHVPTKEHPGGCAVGRNLPFVFYTHLCRAALPVFRFGLFSSPRHTYSFAVVRGKEFLFSRKYGRDNRTIRLMTGAKAATTAERSGYVNRGPRRPQGGDSRGDHVPTKEHPEGCAVGRNLPLVPSTHLCRPSRLPFRPFFLATAHLQFCSCSRKGVSPLKKIWPGQPHYPAYDQSRSGDDRGAVRLC